MKKTNRKIVPKLRKLIKQIRLEKKLRQHNVGDKTYISDLENGRIENMTTDTIEEICVNLGIELELTVKKNSAD